MKVRKPKQKTLPVLLAAALFFATPLAMGAAACDKPVFDHPIPDGRSASQPAMTAAQEAVNEFISQAEDYLDCIESNAARNRARTLSDDMLDEMQNLAAKFNRQLRYFKRANS